MNRQSLITVLVICSMLFFKFNFSDIEALVNSVGELFQQEKAQPNEQVAEKREVVLPQDAILEAHLQFTGNADFKKRINTVLGQVVEGNISNTSDKDPRCRDP